MPLFHKSGERSRLQFADSAINQLYGQLSRPEASRALGITATKILELMEMLYVPNIKDGRMVIPNNYKGSDTFALFAMRSEETILLDDMTTMPVQLMNIQQRDAYGWIDQGQTLDPHLTFPAGFLGFKRTYITEHGIHRTGTSSDDVAKLSRPFIAIRFGDDEDRNVVRATTFHELFHAAEDIEKPTVDIEYYIDSVKGDERKISQERAAYAAEGVYWSEVDSVLRERPVPTYLSSPTRENLVG